MTPSAADRRGFTPRQPPRYQDLHVEARRSDKTFPMTTASELMLRERGAHLLGRHNYLRVDVRTLSHKVIVEIRDYGVYPVTVGRGCSPVGTSGCALNMPGSAASTACGGGPDGAPRPDHTSILSPLRILLNVQNPKVAARPAHHPLYRQHLVVPYTASSGFRAINA